jgi:hypothetical protein
MTATWWVLGVLGGAVLTFALREALIGGTGWLARHTIALAARRLPEDKRELRREEWVAEYDAIVAKGLHIRGLIYAGGTYFGAIRMAHLEKGKIPLSRRLSAIALSVPRFIAVMSFVITVAFATIGVVSGGHSWISVAILATVATTMSYVVKGLIVFAVVTFRTVRGRKD